MSPTRVNASPSALHHVPSKGLWPRHSWLCVPVHCYTTHRPSQVAIGSGSLAGLDPGDTLALVFDQEVARVPVSSDAAVRALLALPPALDLATVNGSWVDLFTLLLTFQRVPPGVGLGPGLAVGAFSVAVRASGGLVSANRQSAPADCSAVAQAGSWGVAPIAALEYKFSTSLRVFIGPPEDPVTWVPCSTCVCWCAGVLVWRCGSHVGHRWGCVRLCACCATF